MPRSHRDVSYTHPELIYPESSFMRHVSTDIREPGLIFGSAGLGGLMLLYACFLPASTV